MGDFHFSHSKDPGLEDAVRRDERQERLLNAERVLRCVVLVCPGGIARFEESQSCHEG